MEFGKGTIISHYKILSEIGKGGMGEVYLAQDTRLDRHVAIKFLNEEFSNDTDKLNRFVQEAKAASALNHPNILTVYDIGESDGTNFIATEFIEGLDLSHFVSEKKVSLESALDISIQIVSALKTAHEAGIVHRDIKPDNAMIRTDGIVKVLDFGLAKLLPQRHGKAETTGRGTEDKTLIAKSPDPSVPASPNTVPGVVMGTPNYMSPEQARGKDIDHQTDIFSFGVVLYEMLTRRLPFAGDTTSDIIASILTKEPQPVEEFNETIPDELKRIVAKSLEKDKRERYQRASDLLEDLKALKKRVEAGEELERTILPEGQETKVFHATTAGDVQDTTANDSRVSVSLEKSSINKILLAIAGIVLISIIGLGYWYIGTSGSKQIDSIAVIPFVNESGDSELEYLADGMTESLITSLSNIPDLSVKARSSVFRYKGKVAAPKTIGSDLTVEAVLLGRFTEKDDVLTLRLELVNAESETVLWSDSFTRKLDGLVTLQKEIAQDVARKLRVRLSSHDQNNLTKAYADNSEVQRLYLRGRFHWAKRDIREFEKAIEYFEKAIELDPNNALSYAGLADAYGLMPFYSKSADPKVYMPRARAAAIKAVELDDELAEAHASLARIQGFYERDFTAAERSLRRAIEINPGYGTARIWYSQFLSILGKHEAALPEMRKALELEPLSLPVNRMAGHYFVFANKFEEAEKQYKRTIELYPDDPVTKQDLAWLYASQGSFSDAAALAMDSIRNSVQDRLWLARYEKAYKSEGWIGIRRVLLEFDLEQKRSQPFYRSYSLAVDYAALGDVDKTLEYLKKAIEERDMALNFVKLDLAFDEVKSDPRFKELIRKMGFPE